MISLFVGYSGYYICRSNLSIATPLIIQEFGAEGINKEVIGQIASLGVMFYAIGKVINGVLGDFIGGKKIFILGMIGSVMATVFFSLSSGLLLFFSAWALNRLVQSMGWGGLVKISTNWFSYKSYGKIMAILSLSYLFGDIVAKIVLGQLINWDMGWRGIFVISAVILAVIAIIEFFVLYNEPKTLGYDKIQESPHNIFKNKGSKENLSISGLLLPYFKSSSFLLLMIMSFGLTAIRESFSFWLPTYLFEVTSFSEGMASQSSSLYSILGLVSILSAGFLSDMVFKGKRGIIIIGGCLPICIVFILMAFPVQNIMLPLIYVSLIGLFLLGPYSFLAGAMSMDLGGQRGAATAAGLIDAVGYLGGSIALWLIGALAQRYGWNYAFISLAIFSFCTGITALIYYFVMEKRNESKKQLKIHHA